MTASNIQSKSVDLNLPLVEKSAASGIYYERLAVVIVPEGETTPTPAQVVAQTNAANGAPTWKNVGKVYNIGAGQVLYMKGPSGLPVNTALKACAQGVYPDGSYGPLYTCSFTTAQAGPQILSRSPSNGWKTAALAGNIVFTYDQNIAAGTGLFTLYDLTLGTALETYNVATGLGNVGGTISISGAQLTINPGPSLAERHQYEVRSPGTVIRNVGGSLFADPIGPGAYSFRAAYADSLAKVIRGSADGLAFDFTDGSYSLKNGATALDGLWNAVAGFALTGALSISENGISTTVGNKFAVPTANFPYSNAGMTLLVEVLADDVDTGLGTNTSTNSCIGFQKKSGVSTPNQHYLVLTKSDTSSRQHNLAVTYRSSGFAESGVEIAAPPTGRNSLFPRGTNFGVVGFSIDPTNGVIHVADSTYSVTRTGIGTAMPKDFTELIVGPIASPLTYKFRCVLVTPEFIDAATLIARCASFLNFRDA